MTTPQTSAEQKGVSKDVKAKKGRKGPVATSDGILNFFKKNNTA